MKWVVAYISAAFAFGIMDALWLRWAGPNLYQPTIGTIMADDVRLPAAATFYLIYIAGMVWFAVRPALQSGKVQIGLINGALLGGLCYATFDLTSQAVFKVWATHITIADILWGMFVTAIASATSSWIALKIKG